MAFSTSTIAANDETAYISIAALTNVLVGASAGPFQIWLRLTAAGTEYLAFQHEHNDVSAGFVEIPKGAAVMIKNLSGSTITYEIMDAA
jgi:hypothetical protein